MGISLEILERYGWTWFDFVFLRPKRFHELYIQQPNRYLSPMQFVAATIILYSSVAFVLNKLIMVSSPANSPSNQPIVTLLNNENMFYPLTIITTVFFFFIDMFFGKVSAWLVRRKATMKNLATAKCYASSVILIPITVIVSLMIK